MYKTSLNPDKAPPFRLRDAGFRGVLRVDSSSWASPTRFFPREAVPHSADLEAALFLFFSDVFFVLAREDFVISYSSNSSYRR